MSAMNVISCTLCYDFSVNVAWDIDQTFAAWKLWSWEYPSNTLKCSWAFSYSICIETSNSLLKMYTFFTTQSLPSSLKILLFHAAINWAKFEKKKPYVIIARHRFTFQRFVLFLRSYTPSNTHTRHPYTTHHREKHILHTSVIYGEKW